MYCGCPGAAKIGGRVGWLPGGGKGAGGSIRGLAASASLCIWLLLYKGQQTASHLHQLHRHREKILT